MKQNKQQDLAAIARYLLDLAKQKGAKESAVAIGESLGQSLQWRNGQLETLSREQERDISLTVYRGHRKGRVNCNDTSEAALEQAVTTALAAATYTEADEFAGLADPADLATVDKAQMQALDLVHLPLPDLSALTDLAERAERAAYAYDARIVNSEGAGVYAMENRFWYAASNGFSAGGDATCCGVNVSVLAQSGAEQQSNYAYDRRCCFADLATPEQIGEQAAEKALAALDARAVASGDYPVVFAPEVAAGLIGHLLQALGGQTQFRRLGFLTGALGREVLPPWLSLIEEPSLMRGAGSALFDHEGIAVRDPVIVAAGRIHRYLLDSYAARRLKMVPSGNSGGVHNLKLVAADDHVRSPAELYRSMGCGVVVTDLMGQGVNGLTGDYSRGASGFWVEDGRIAHPVDGITIAGTLGAMFSSIVALGNDCDDRGRIHAPSILVEKMTVAR